MLLGALLAAVWALGLPSTWGMVFYTITTISPTYLPHPTAIHAEELGTLMTQDALDNRTGLCVYQDRHIHVLRAGFDTCIDCTQNCLRWDDCAWVWGCIEMGICNLQPQSQSYSQAFYDGTNISRDAIPPFDCTTHTLTALGFDPELTRIRGGLTPVIPARDENWFTLTEPVRVGGGGCTVQAIDGNTYQLLPTRQHMGVASHASPEVRWGLPTTGSSCMCVFQYNHPTPRVRGMLATRGRGNTGATSMQVDATAQ